MVAFIVTVPWSRITHNGQPVHNMLVERMLWFGETAMKDGKQWIVKIGVFVLCIIAVLYTGKEGARRVGSGKVKEAEEKPCVVLDAGHGKTSGRPKEFELECSVLSSVSSSGSRI